MSGVRFRSISPEATPEEVAAIVAALAVVEQERRAGAGAAPAAGVPASAWRTANRLAHRRSGMTRGPWRLSGRIQRRPRA